MRFRSTMGILALGLTAATAAAQSPHRLVIIVASAADPRTAQQRKILEQDTTSLRERDVAVQNLTPEAARRNRPDLGVSEHSTFEVLLVGKDGGVKLRRDEPVTASEIVALIDSMPMRQEEMRR